MRAVDILRKKRDGEALNQAEIEAFVMGVTRRSWPDYQASALLMAIYLRGMSAEETLHLTHAMAASGSRLDLSDIAGPKVDKHSTGGVGDKTSLVVVPLAAACGVIVPKMSGRGLGHAGGTLDKLEAIPGFRVHLEPDEFHRVLRSIGCCLIGQSGDLAPADKLLYALRDVTATVESIPLIAASVLSKKLAEGIDALVLDVKCGQGAYVKTRAQAQALARLLVETGSANGLRTKAVMTAMDAPLGRAVGNALEVKECVQALRGEGPADLERLSIALAGHMLLAGNVAGSLAEAESQVREALTSGRGVEKLRAVIELQGGDPRVVDDPGLLPVAPHQVLVRADRQGHVACIDAEMVGHAAMLLGAGRDKKEDAIDPAVGAVVKAAVGDEVRSGDPLVEVHYRKTDRLERALDMLRRAWQIGDEKPAPRPLILDDFE